MHFSYIKMNITSIHQYYFILTTSQLFCHNLFSTRIRVRACTQMTTIFIRI